MDSTITKDSIPHITLKTHNVGLPSKHFPGLSKHVRTVIKASNVRIFQRYPFLGGEHRRTHGYIKKGPGNIVRNSGEDFSHDDLSSVPLQNSLMDCLLKKFPWVSTVSYMVHDDAYAFWILSAIVSSFTCQTLWF